MIEISKTAMVLAAGLGKRLGEVTKNTPKPLVPIGETCCLEIAINSLKKAGFKRIIVNTHYLAAQVELYVKRFDAEIILSYEPELLETAGGVRKVLAEFDGKSFAVVNADMYWQDSDSSIIHQMAEAMQESDDFCLGVTPLSNAQGYPGQGDFSLADGLLQRPTDHVIERYVYIGVQLINPMVIQSLPIAPRSLSSLYTNSAEKKSLRGVAFNGTWVDVGNLDGLSLARHIAKQ